MNPEKKYVPPKLIDNNDAVFMSSIGKKLKTLRNHNKLTLSALSQQTNISRKTLQLYEEGRIYPNFSILLKLIHYYNVTPFEFFIELNKDDLNNNEL